MNEQKRGSQKLMFDYIVIGTGPTGAIIAKTLTDNKSTSVLLLEAGENNDKDKPIRNSTLAPNLEPLFFPHYFWQGEGVPQRNLDNRMFEWTTGRLAGGGSSINGEQYVRPTKAVLREWEKLLGTLWSPEQAISHFKKLEKYNGKTSNRNARGLHGHVDIRQAPENPTNMAKKLVKAIAQATGFSEILDYNDPNTPLGPFTRWQLYQDPNGQRESSSTAFLSPDIVSPNGVGVNGRKLHVLYKSTALRVIFEDQKATGVEFLQEGNCVQAYAEEKVILSAGINSTQLLMLSGIGPSKALKEAGIPIVFHNPNVGRNLNNHTLNTAVFTTNPKDRPLPLQDQNALYTGGAFLPDPRPGANKHRRAVQLIGIGTEGNLAIAILYLKPESRGSIVLQNNDPLKIVLADEGFLHNVADLEAVKNIYRIYIKRIAMELNAIDPTYRLVSPSFDVIKDDKKLGEFIKQNFDHNHHQQGEIRMAPLKNGGVVDEVGQVHGVKNLIVADASLIPFTVDENTSAAAYLIGSTIAQQLVNKHYVV
jgi:choline dehydrogenase